MNDSNVIRGIKLLVLDFDGVLTDNRVWIAQDGSESVACWRGDGIGIQRLLSLGIEVIILSSEPSKVVAERAKKLKIHCLHGCEDKKEALLKYSEIRGYQLPEIAYIGNDINDSECLKAVGLPIVVADAHPDVVLLAKWRTALNGGHGAVREVCDYIWQVRSGGFCYESKSTL